MSPQAKLPSRVHSQCRHMFPGRSVCVPLYALEAALSAVGEEQGNCQAGICTGQGLGGVSITGRGLGFKGNLPWQISKVDPKATNVNIASPFRSLSLLAP